MPEPLTAKLCNEHDMYDVSYVSMLTFLLTVLISVLARRHDLCRWPMPLLSATSP